ncbi:MAG: iron-containing alcohol dehydrogenase, partial [Candidatus Sericytochromatia bacterium]
MSEPLTRIILVGYMGAGKSSVGRALAERLGWKFVDTDELIQALSGRTIPELFADGEPFFRQWEAQAIATLFAEDRLVIAAGGGALTHPESRRMLQALGPTVWLDAPPDVLWARAGQDPDRPLSLDEADFRARHAARLPLYRQSPLRVDTERLAPEAAAAWLERQLFAEASTVPVALGDRSYPIVIQPGGLPALPRLLEGPPGRCLVITDSHVRDLYAEPVIAALELSGWHPALAVVPAGEPSKCLEQASALYDQCVRMGLKRHHPVIALGGGVVGDLAGFVAATYQRGVPFVQVPTTLLAQIDSSVGGKVGINHPGGKNLIGAFYQPKLVLADTSTLLTLSDREYLAGLAELVKYGVIMDADLFALIEDE